MYKKKCCKKKKGLHKVDFLCECKLFVWLHKIWDDIHFWVEIVALCLGVGYVAYSVTRFFIEHVTIR